MHFLWEEKKNKSILKERICWDVRKFAFQKVLIDFRNFSSVNFKKDFDILLIEKERKILL